MNRFCLALVLALCPVCVASAEDYTDDPYWQYMNLTVYGDGEPYNEWAFQYLFPGLHDLTERVASIERGDGIWQTDKPLATLQGWILNAREEVLAAERYLLAYQDALTLNDEEYATAVMSVWLQAEEAAQGWFDLLANHTWVQIKLPWNWWNMPGASIPRAT